MSSTETRPVDLSDSLRTIRTRFVAELDLRRSELQALVAGGDHPADKDERLQQARRIAHRLAGVSGTLGFPRLGRIAADTDDSIGEALRAPDGPGPMAAQDAIEALVAAITQVANSDSDCEAVGLQRDVTRVG